MRSSTHLSPPEFYSKIYFIIISFLASAQVSQTIHFHCPPCRPLHLHSARLRFLPGSWGFVCWPAWGTAAAWNTPSSLLWWAQTRCHPVGEEEDRPVWASIKDTENKWLKFILMKNDLIKIACACCRNHIGTESEYICTYTRIVRCRLEGTRWNSSLPTKLAMEGKMSAPHRVRDTEMWSPALGPTMGTRGRLRWVAAVKQEAW